MNDGIRKEENPDEGKMTEPIDCRIFGDQLDALVRGDLPEEGRRQLLHHARACSECRVQLEVHKHLVDPSLEALESRVPQEIMDGMWDSVKRGIDTKGRDPLVRGHRAMMGAAAQRPPTTRRLRWFVPSLAAAAVVLLFSTGFLYWQTTRLRAQTTALARQVEDQRHWMAELDLSGSDPIARTAALAGRSPWNRALSRQDEISLAGLRRLLAGAPGDRIILTREQVDAVLRSRISLSPPILRDALSRIGSGDGVTVDELVGALDGLGVDPETTVPTAELVALLS